MSRDKKGKENCTLTPIILNLLFTTRSEHKTSTSGYFIVYDESTSPLYFRRANRAIERWGKCCSGNDNLLFSLCCFAISRERWFRHVIHIESQFQFDVRRRGFISFVLWVARNSCWRNFHTNPAYCHNRLVWINIRSPSDAIFHPMKSKIFRLFIVRLWMGEWDCNENDAAHLGACCGIIEFILCVFLKRFLKWLRNLFDRAFNKLKWINSKFVLMF